MGLKLLAIFAMVVDHLNTVLLDRSSYLMTLFGRLAFPIFAYLVVYNLLNRTRNAKQYLLRLWLFALVSQVPHALAFPGHHILNIFFTLAAGATAVWLLEQGRWPTSVALVPVTLFSDYGPAGFALMLSIYAWLRFGERAVTLLFLFASLLLANDWIYALYVPAAWLALKYADRIEGLVAYRPSWKMFFYWFYPAHLMVLWAVSAVL